jgi:hypothetical protein
MCSVVVGEVYLDVNPGSEAERHLESMKTTRCSRDDKLVTNLVALRLYGTAARRGSGGVAWTFHLNAAVAIESVFDLLGADPRTCIVAPVLKPGPDRGSKSQSILFEEDMPCQNTPGRRAHLIRCRRTCCAAWECRAVK